MKKIISALILTLCVVSFSFAQQHEHVVKEKTKVKRTSTMGQKVHNVFHRHHKHYSGYKTKHVVRHKKM